VTYQVRSGLSITTGKGIRSGGAIVTAADFRGNGQERIADLVRRGLLIDTAPAPASPNLYGESPAPAPADSPGAPVPSPINPEPPRPPADPRPAGAITAGKGAIRRRRR
jgi:hypothetical protein